jgi:hypothetical protein
MDIIHLNKRQLSVIFCRVYNFSTIAKFLIYHAQLLGVLPVVLPSDGGQCSSVHALLHRKGLNGARLRRVHDIVICIVLW